MSRGKELVHGERQREYGPPDESFSKIAMIWSAVIGTTVSKEQVAQCMVGLKLVREAHAHKPDNLDDIDGYVEILRMLAPQPEPLRAFAPLSVPLKDTGPVRTTGK